MRILFAILYVLLVAPIATACGPFFPCSYIVYGGVSLDTFPEPLFAFQCKAILGREFGLSAVENADAHGEYVEPLNQTLNAELTDLAAALEGDPKATDTLLLYREMREQLNGSVDPYSTASPSAFDLARYDELLRAVPAEFAAYVRGAAAYHVEAYDLAAAAFREVLALPEEDRQYRSVWAAYMLGKCALRATPDDPAVSRKWFEETRALAAAGFSDALNLAADSWNWQAHGALEAGNHADALRAYARAYAESDGDSTALTSINWTCDYIFGKATINPELVEDTLCRQIVTAWALSRYSDDTPVTRWLDALQANPPDDPTPGADHLAWAAYRLGEFDTAMRWLDHAQPDSPWSRWVEAKLALREGRFDDAKAALEAAHATFASGNQDMPMNPTDYLTFSAADFTAGDLGMLELRAGNFDAAFDFLAKTLFWGDTAYLAERVVPLDNLIQHVESMPAEDANNKNNTEGEHSYYPLRDTAASLRHLLARRLAREGRWSEAAPYYPSNEALQGVWGVNTPEQGLSAVALEVDTLLSAGRSKRNSKEERAEALMAAAQHVRDWGMELMGTELGPDWSIENGNADLSPWEGESGYFSSGYTPGPDEIARIESTAPANTYRFHYRFVAAELMWEAAELLPRNDVLAAEALYRGGMFIKYDDPDFADRFYKSLVRRHPNLLIAQQADGLRWFPSEFTDVVLYTARDEPPFRKRDIAIVLTLLAATAFTVWVRRTYGPHARDAATA